MQIGGDGVSARPPPPSLRPTRPVRPGMDLFDFPNGPALDQQRSHPVLDVGMDLDAHLGDDVRLAGGGGQLPGLVEIVRQRLLTVDVFAAQDGRHADGGVHVVGRAHIDGVDAAGLLVQQLPPIGVRLGVGISFAAAARLSLFTSQMATGLTGPSASGRVRPPIPPTPMDARFSFRLGGSWPWPPGHGSGGRSGTSLVDDGGRLRKSRRFIFVLLSQGGL